jgi:hypothetical protein
MRLPQNVNRQSRPSSKAYLCVTLELDVSSLLLDLNRLLIEESP